MKIILKVLLIFTPLALLCGCDKVTVGMRMRRFISRPVVFPSSMVYVEGVQKVHDTLSDAKTRLVVYIDSSRCSICGLNKLNRFEEYAALSESNLDFRIVILICPDSETRSSVEMDIEHRRFPFDVFIDYEGAFPRLNPNLPRKDIRFHCFLLDKNNIPILVGDPTISRQIGILFKEKYSESCLDK